MYCYAWASYTLDISYQAVMGLYMIFNYNIIINKADYYYYYYCYYSLKQIPVEVFTCSLLVSCDINKVNYCEEEIILYYCPVVAQ